MASWTSEELNRIGNAREIEIASPRKDGTLRKPVPIWVVRVGDGLYIRSFRGKDGAWYRTAEARGQARIQAAGLEKDVDIVDADPDLNDEIDEAYRNKYGRHSQYVAPMVAPGAQATTIRLVPRDESS